MRINKTFLLFLFIYAQAVSGQIPKEFSIQGKITVESNVVEGVQILNITSSKSTFSNKEGVFWLGVKEGDVLVFSAFNLEILNLKISKEHLVGKEILVNMEQKNNQLDEVVVKKQSEINAKTLGIISQNQKTYTPAERKLRTAGDFKPIMLLGLLGGSMPLDPLINKINGRTKRLKKEVILEGKEHAIKKLDFYFCEPYYTKELKIPSQYVNGFKFYLIENPIFVTKLKNNDKAMMGFLMIELSIKYIEIIACEDK